MRLALGLFLLLFAAVAHADDLREIRGGEPVVLRSDRAYFVFRTLRPEGVLPAAPVFLRIPTSEEMARYDEARRRAYAQAEPDLIRRYEAELRRRSPNEAPPERPSLQTFNFLYSETPNLHAVSLGRPFVPGTPESLYIVEATPGDYVFYGMTYPGLQRQLHLCMCLGTVGFNAAPGIITDLGYILSDQVHAPSPLPELRAESGLGPSSYSAYTLWGATVRPVRPDSSLPEALRSLERRSATYRAVGKFVEPRAIQINRLAPVPGILDYENGRVVDVASGQAVPDLY